MVRAGGTPILVGERLGEGGQGVVHAAQIGGASCAVKWYRAVPKPKELRGSITALIDSGCPHPAFIWPFDLVVSNEISGFGYVMTRLDPAFQSLGELLGRANSPPFRVMINIGLHLVSAFEALHGAGLCYRDINSKNLWVDADKAEVGIIDNDNVGTDDAEVFVWGTSGFMAPEVVRRENFPTGHTDLHSLAVLMFYLCVDVPIRPPLLQVPGGTVVLADGANITSHHLHRDRNHDSVIGMVEAHPTKPGEVVLRNVGPDNWVMTPEGESAITVASKRRLGVRTMVIDFGSVKGRISVD